MSEDLPDSKPVKIYEWVKSPDGVFEVYTNYIKSSWTKFDVRVRLGQLIPSDDARDFLVEERVAITIAWPHAKIIHTLLGQLVESYEKTNGEIPILNLPPDPTA